MGFKAEKQKVMECLKTGAYEHDVDRDKIDTKNLFKIGLISAKQVSDVIKRAKGHDYHTEPHHSGIKGVNVHIIKLFDKVTSCNWYIKWYYIDPNVFFISVHH